MKLGPVKLFESYQQEHTLLSHYISEMAQEVGKLRILEGGCGQRWPLDLNNKPYRLVGLDINEEALSFRKNVIGDLDESVLGDIRYVQMEPRSFDVIYCSFVLEHIHGAESALKNFVRWLKPKGLLILRIPDRNSVWGFISRLAPHWVHVLYKRWIRKKTYNPKDDLYGPFPTVFDKIVSRKGIHQFCRVHQLIVREEYGRGFDFSSPDFVSILEIFLLRFFSLVSCKTLATEHNDLIYILEKGE